MSHRPRITPTDEAHAKRLEQYRASKRRAKDAKAERMGRINELLMRILANPGPVSRFETIADIAARYRKENAA